MCKNHLELKGNANEQPSEVKIKRPTSNRDPKVTFAPPNHCRQSDGHPQLIKRGARFEAAAIMSTNNATTTNSKNSPDKNNSKCQFESYNTRTDLSSPNYSNKLRSALFKSTANHIDQAR